MENVILEKNGHVSKITINRPKALNALSTDVLKDLEEAVNTVKNDDDTYCLIITGAGDKSFVAGADIAEMKDKTVEEAAEYGAYGNKIFREIETLHCPVIAAVNGFALGGGCELAMSCDIRVAADNAVFGQPEVGLGITPGFGGTQRLARLVPAGIAKEMIFTARNIKADKAEKIGLVNAVVPAEELMATVEKMAAGIAKNAPIAVAQAKKAINNGLNGTIDEGIAEEVKDFSDCFATEDQRYGMDCFLNKVRDKQFSNK
ncbi:enoyl-CoA hydratase-related protein [Faecalibaculum rodentium]|uniref:enoyl-CoA hydratase-related protein n=2 Tax=Faecalibaculum rodentium TaxID=1702221 RepID=UPI0025A68751|nr:enoyl-CoA hydratase-related protein [Faecalibaculum rodentium]